MSKKLSNISSNFWKKNIIKPKEILRLKIKKFINLYTIF